MSTRADTLIEIGTEELPPKALSGLSTAFAGEIEAGLRKTGLQFSSVERFASPRRLSVRIRELSKEEPDRQSVRKGPAIKAAFDEDGNPSKAGLGFARSCGVDISELGRDSDAKGEYLVFVKDEPGRSVHTLLPEILSAALAALPIPKRMRWGAGDAEFVRPVHWLILLFGDQVINTELFGIPSSRQTCGHRFHGEQHFDISSAESYESQLRERGHVIADFEERRRSVEEQVIQAGNEAGGEALISGDLLDEVTALVEWPAPIIGAFEERFLALPREVLIASMQEHQRYFPVLDSHGDLLPRFITIANLVSTDPAQIAAGNERVIRPRLSDGMFFYEADLKQGLESWRPMLDKVVYQDKLGTLGDKTRRIGEVCANISDLIGADPVLTARIAELSRCDLMSSMVGEFPELQGTMGSDYARKSGEQEIVSNGLAEFYLPRQAGDALPASAESQAVVIADRLDSIVGIFGIGLRPSGDKDPYGLRRAALGVLRICIERELSIDLQALIAEAVQSYGKDLLKTDTSEEVLDYMLDRLRAYYLDAGHSPQVFEAVLSRRPTAPLDFHRRIEAVSAFSLLPEAQALSAANKRIGNILRKAESEPGQVSESVLSEDAERNLHVSMQATRASVATAIGAQDYTQALKSACRIARAG